MLNRLFWLLVVLPLAVILILFAVANRGPAIVSFDPFSGNSPVIAFEMPLYLLMFIALILGVLIGGLAAWLAQGKWRRMARKKNSEAAKWRYRAETASDAAEQAKAALPAPQQS